MLKKTIAFICGLVCACTLWAGNGDTQTEVIANYNRSGSNHYAYPIPGDMPAPALSAAPAGYEAFYISHYGRHGSRWLTSGNSYQRPLRLLERAGKDGHLTPVGERLLADLRRVWLNAENRAGDLSDVGAEQHQGIARRMAKNFPSVFAGDAAVDARSTMVLRCILSMQNETMMLRAANPGLHITTDASYRDMEALGFGQGEDTLANPIRKQVSVFTDSLYRAHIDPTRFLNMVFSDTTGLGLRPGADVALMRSVFNIAGSLQSHHVFDGMTMFHYLTNDEIFELWRLRNIYWYTHWGNSPQNGNRMPYTRRTLLQLMIDEAERAIATGRRGADLRFGHDTCLLPLACLMELDNVDLSTTDMDNLHQLWQDYNIIPKAGNIQMVFYRPVGGTGDILVKVLLNEHETTLPVATDGPYCRWNDLRDYYLNKLKTRIDWSE